MSIVLLAVVALASAGHEKSPQKSNDNAVKASKAPKAKKNVFKTKSQHIIPPEIIQGMVNANKAAESTSFDSSRDAKDTVPEKLGRVSKINWEEYESTLSKK